MAETSEHAPGIRRDDLLELVTQIVEMIPDMVFVKDAADLRFVLLNRAGEELLGHSRDELLGKNDYDFFPKEQADFFTQKDREVLESGVALDIAEEPIETPRGRRWLHTKKVPLLAADGTPRYLLGVSEDITEKRRLEHMKDDLLSVASHELRSPTAAMIGTLTLLDMTLGPTLDAESKEMLGLAKENGSRMIELLDSCLDVGRLEKEQVQLHMRDVDLAAAVRETVRLNQPFADTFGVRFVIGQMPEAARVRMDPERFTQSLTNLMTNAAKFSPRGDEVRVSLKQRETGFRVMVTDHGPGIPDEFRDRVFEKFARARTVATGPNEGAGLGLRIAHQLVERMGGEVGFFSQPGAGATFFIDLPAA